jgi:hypothetical protein
MPLVLLILFGSIAIGRLAGGRLRNLAAVNLRRTWLAFAAAGAQVVLTGVTLLGGPGDVLGRPLLTVSHLCLLGFILANRTTRGMRLVLIGFVLNAVVIVANGAMPVDPAALVALGGTAAIDPGKHQLLDDATLLPWLADIIAVPLLRSVISVGDIILALGVGILVVAQMRSGPTTAAPATSAAPADPAAREFPSAG